MHVLVVDDDVELNELVSKALTKDGYVVDVAVDLAEARSRVHDGFDVVVLDLGLPDGSGLDLCKELRTRGHQVPILLLTGREWLVCRATAQQSAHWVLMGEPKAEILEHRPALLFGGLLALVAVALGGIAAGVAVGKWSLRPLRTVQQALEAVDGTTDGAVPSLPRFGLAEVDAITRSLEHAWARLDEELNRSRRFAADAAHELRTPLAKLRTELELLLEDEPSGADVQAPIQNAVTRVEDLAKLVDRLLMLATPGATLRGARLVSMSGVVEDVVIELGATRVEAALDGDGLVVGDEAVLTTAISNAIGNALKFSKGTVRVRVWNEDGEVVVRIDDEGQGLPEEQRERAFDSFYRAPQHRGTSGHGIGLALIKHIADAHEGTAAFVHEPPGAHLEIRLPSHTAPS